MLFPVNNGRFNLFREKFGIGDDNKVFLYQGGFTMGKGIELMLEAFARLEDKYVLVLMGFGRYQDMVEEAAANNNNIFYHEAVPMDKLVAYSKSADWGLLANQNISKSNNYSLPNKLFEYAMAEIPILALPTEEIKNKVEVYKIGLVAESESVEDFIKLIKRSDAYDEKDFVDGLRKMKGDFNWQLQEKKLVKIYKDA